MFGRLFKPASTAKTVENTLGVRPGNIDLYNRAFTHSSIHDNADKNNERLEYLGDAILGAVIADFLFKKYPYKGEGFLTEMRSKMVNRQQLNGIAVKMGLKRLTVFNRFDSSLRNSQIFGNTLEALVGAIYLDKGYEKTQRWVHTRIITPYLFVDELESKNINLKNKLIGWAAKQHKELEFKTLEEKLENGRRIFTVAVIVNGETIASAPGFNKKDASEAASQKACEALQGLL